MEPYNDPRCKLICYLLGDLPFQIWISCKQARSIVFKWRETDQRKKCVCYNYLVSYYYDYLSCIIFQKRLIVGIQIGDLT